ncbi:MAG: response regulator [Pseudomonadota bacterium]
MEKTLRLLIVDDDAGMIQTLNYVLTEKGYEVVTVSKGADALEALKKSTFDVVFSDIKMPGMNGVELLRQVKALTPETPIVLITAYTMHELVEEAKEAGAYKLFFKPLDLDAVLAFINKLKQKRDALPKVSTLPGSDENYDSLMERIEEMEAQLREKDKLIAELQHELASILENPTVLLEQEQRKKQSEHLENILNPKQIELFNLLRGSEMSYEEIYGAAVQKGLDIRDMEALRLQLSRLNKKLEEETIFSFDRIRRDKVLYLTIKNQ